MNLVMQALWTTTSCSIQLSYAAIISGLFEL
jgi:hypothetical protein